METFDELWNQFEHSEEFTEVSNKRHLCYRMLNLLEQNDSRRYRIKLEYDLFDFYMNNISNIKDLDKLEEAVLKEHMDDFIKSHINEDGKYYESRVKETTNLPDKWKYSFICWVLKKEQFWYLERTIMSLLECVRLSYIKKLQVEFIYNLTCAYHIAVIFGMKDKFAREIAKEAFFIVNNVKDKKQIYRPVRILIYLDILDHSSATRLIDISTQTANSVKREDSYGYQVLFELSIDLVRFLNLEQTERNSAIEGNRFTLGKMWEEAGDELLADNNAELASNRYQHALKQYSMAGKRGKQKNEEVIIKLQTACQNFNWDVDTMAVVTQFIPTNIFLPSSDTLMSLDDELELIRVISQENRIIPNLSDIKQWVENNFDKYPLLGATNRLGYNGKNPISSSKDWESNKETEIRKQFALVSQLNELQLANEVRKLELNKKISALGFIRFISCFEFLNETLLRFISYGIIKHFAHDYVSSIHILVPQIEAVLRALLLYKKVQTPSRFFENEEKINEILLHTLLRDNKVKALLGDDFATYMQLKFTDQLGPNLRNRVSHGLLDSITECSYETSYPVLHVILMLLGNSL